jgi:hypothetical protein
MLRKKCCTYDKLGSIPPCVGIILGREKSEYNRINFHVLCH